MRLHSGLLLLTLLAPTLSYAQQPSPWQGEWGHFSDDTGARLTITDCSGPSCKFFLDVEQNQGKAAFIAGYTDRGDPDLATKVAARIAGRYRHSFESGDVQGDSYRATDTLTLTPISRNSIHFNVHLNFYNGHTCSLSGGALFRKDGSFVFDDVPADADSDSVCHLAIVPTTNGVELHDLTGSGCKNISCGERGGYNGAGFSLSDRVSAKKDRVSTSTTSPPKKPSTR
jgi:hypothetical protein